MLQVKASKIEKVYNFVKLLVAKGKACHFFVCCSKNSFNYIELRLAVQAFFIFLLKTVKYCNEFPAILQHNTYYVAENAI